MRTITAPIEPDGFGIILSPSDTNKTQLPSVTLLEKCRVPKIVHTHEEMVVTDSPCLSYARNVTRIDVQLEVGHWVHYINDAPAGALFSYADVATVRKFAGRLLEMADVAEFRLLRDDALNDLP